MPLPPTHFNDDARDEDVTEEVEARAASGDHEWTGATGDAKDESPAYVASQEDVGEETIIAQPVVEPSHSAESAVAQAGAQTAFSARLASAAAADDALLDLGDIEPPSAASDEADDFILDLSDDAPAPTASHQSNAAMSVSAFDEREDAMPASHEVLQADAAGAFAEASHGEAVHHAPQAFTPTLVETEEGRDEEASAIETEDAGQAYEALEVEEPFGTGAAQQSLEPTVVPAEEPLPVGMEGSRINRGAEGDVARPPVSESSVETAGAAVASGKGDGEQIGLHQLSPEVIDAIARRAVEHLSERVVQDIAWEVVPQLAELLIKRRLDEEK